MTSCLPGQPLRVGARRCFDSNLLRTGVHYYNGERKKGKKGHAMQKDISTPRDKIEEVAVELGLPVCSLDAVNSPAAKRRQSKGVPTRWLGSRWVEIYR